MSDDQLRALVVTLIRSRVEQRHTQADAVAALLGILKENNHKETLGKRTHQSATHPCRRSLL